MSLKSVKQIHFFLFLNKNGSEDTQDLAQSRSLPELPNKERRETDNVKTNAKYETTERKQIRTTKEEPPLIGQ